MIEVVQGNGPIVLGLPHTGTDVPPDIWARLNETGRALADTDWHIDQLYDGLLSDVTMVRTPVHRYVIDVNRGADDASLYPGQNTTGLCPVTDFGGQPIWQDGEAPDAAEIADRAKRFHAPYHSALSTEMGRVREKHGLAILYDCHSIRSHIPYLFDGELPDFNIGTNSSTTCGKSVENLVEEHCRRADAYTTVVNGRFKGGWTTRHYGQPHAGIHAVQMELAQSTYMTERAPWTRDPERADRLRSVLGAILADLETLALSGDLT